MSRRSLTLGLMLFPYLLGLVGLVFIPALFTFALIFTNYNLLTPPVWVGLENIYTLADDFFFGTAVKNTFVYVLVAVALRMGGAFGLALFLQRHRQLVFARSAIYLPAVIPNVAYALIWLLIFNPRYGPLNQLWATLHLPTSEWLANPQTALAALVFISIWQLGEGFIVLLASLNETPAALYEMAAIDGAGPVTRFWSITMPLLLPRLLLLTARDILVVMQLNFVPSLVMTHGGPGYATLFLPLYTFWLAFDDLRFGYAATVIGGMYLLSLGLVLLMAWLSRRWAYEGAV